MIQSLFFWITLPLLLPQALFVRLTAPRFAAAAGPSTGSMGKGPNLQLLAVGDSIIAGVGARTLANALVGQTSAALSNILGRTISWSAHGQVGADSESTLCELLPDIETSNVDVVMISVGVNDITSLKTMRRWRNQLRALLDRISQQYPGAVIAVAGMPPLGSFPLLPQPMRALFGMRSKKFDAATREIIENYPHAIHVPIEFDAAPERFADDGFHPSEFGYVEFGKAMASHIAGRLN